MTTPDYPDFQTPQQHANTIAATGVPLLTLASSLLQQTFNPPALAKRSSASLSITQIGYEIVVGASFGVVPTNPFIRVTLTWSQTGFTGYTDTETFIVPACNTPGAFTVIGQGPTRGDSLVVSVTNLDPLQTATVSVGVAENSRIYDRSKWRWDNATDAGLTVAGFTLPSLPADESVLGLVDAVAIPASTAVSYLCGMRNGTIQFGYEMNGGVAASLTLRLQPAPTTEYSTHFPLGAVAAPSFSFQFAGPRAPVIVRLVNTSAGPITVTFGVVCAEST